MSDHPLETIRSAISESQRFATANEAHFDQRARPSDDSHHENPELARRTLAAMNKAWPELFDEDYTEAMDYACGTGASPQLGCFGASEGLSPHLLPGMVSQQLCQYVKRVVGVDISQVSVDRYNARASEQGLSPSEMRAVRAELKGEPGELDSARFDVILVSPLSSVRLHSQFNSYTRQCCAAYHHFPDIAETTRVLASFLKLGGALLVADVHAAPDGRELWPAAHHHIVPHKHGFTEEEMRGAFEGAGLKDFEMRDAFKAKMRATGGQTRWFIAKGLKPV